MKPDSGELAGTNQTTAARAWTVDGAGAIDETNSRQTGRNSQGTIAFVSLD